jgi:hypothetical protein
VEEKEGEDDDDKLFFSKPLADPAARMCRFCRPLPKIICATNHQPGQCLVPSNGLMQQLVHEMPDVLAEVPVHKLVVLT